MDAYSKCIIYDPCYINFIYMSVLVFWFRKINRVNAIIAKFLTILKLQPNRSTLRNDLTQAVKIYGEEQRIVAAFLFTGIFQADKPREFEGRALSRQAANLSSKKIANCEYASPQSRTGMVHFLAISLTLI